MQIMRSDVLDLLMEVETSPAIPTTKPKVSDKTQTANANLLLYLMFHFGFIFGNLLFLVRITIDLEPRLV